MGCPDPEPAEWNMMWTDEGVELNEQMGLEVLRCERCGGAATFLQAAEDGTVGAYWCTSDAEERGAPAAQIRLARER